MTDTISKGAIVLLLAVICAGCTAGPSTRAELGPWTVERLLVDGREFDVAGIAVNRVSLDDASARLDLRLRICRTFSFSWQLVQGADKPFGLRPRDAVISTGDCQHVDEIEQALIRALRQARRIDPGEERLVLDSESTRFVLSRF